MNRTRNRRPSRCLRWCLSLAFFMAGSAIAQTNAPPSSRGVGPGALVPDDDPEWVRIAEETGKIPPDQIKEVWIANEKEMATRAAQVQKMREEVWKLAAEARQNDPACKAIRDQIEQMRKKLDEAAHQNPAVAACEKSQKDAERSFYLSVKKRQLLGQMMRKLPDDEQLSILKAAQQRQTNAAPDKADAGAAASSAAPGTGSSGSGGPQASP